MRWYRDHIRQGSWLALIALAINVVLSFGHVHGLDGKSPDHRSGALIAAVASHDGGKSHGRTDDGLADSLCPICAAAATMANGLAPTPPSLPIDFTFARIDRPIKLVAAAVEPQRAAFQSRAPPIS